MTNIIIPFIQCLSQVLTANLGHILAVPSAEAGLEHFRWHTFPNISSDFICLATFKQGPCFLYIFTGLKHFRWRTFQNISSDFICLATFKQGPYFLYIFTGLKQGGAYSQTYLSDFICWRPTVSAKLHLIGRF